MNTKKQQKIKTFMTALLLILPIFLNLSVLIEQQVFAAEENTNQVIIHKKKMMTLPDPTIQNTGKEMPDFDKYQGLADIEFKAYDVTVDFYEARAKGQTIDQAKATVENNTKDKPVETKKTDSEGDLVLNLPKKSNGKDAVYTIAETPKAGVNAAANMVVAFPVYEMIKQNDGSFKYGDVELNPVHIYPKNTISSTGDLVISKVGTAENEALDGAEFVISKNEGGVTKYIQSAKDGLYTWSENKDTAFHFVTGKDYVASDNSIKENDGTKGQIKVSDLEVGKYIVEEVKAPDNAELIEDQTKHEIEIKEDQTEATEITVKNDTTNVEKTTPELNGNDVAIGEAIKYEIKTNIPEGIADKVGEVNKYTKFNLIDKHDEELTFNNTPNGPTAYALYDGDQLIDQSHYTITENKNGFIVAIDPEYITQLTPGGTLKFNYYMHLNEKADPTKGFKNEANVDNGHTVDKTPPTPEVVTGGKRFVKVDADVNEQSPLKGAKFVVRDADKDDANYLVIDPTTKAVSWTTDESLATEFTSDDQGLLSILGLDYGTYFLEETEAPNDYVKLGSRIEFTVDEDSYGTPEQLVSPEKIPNHHKGTLPSTGGKGIVIFIVIGLLAIVSASFYFVNSRNAKRA